MTLSQNYIEFYEQNYPRVKAQDSIFRRAQTLENRTKESNERKYVRNICTTCFVAKSVLTQECNCN